MVPITYGRTAGKVVVSRKVIVWLTITLTTLPAGKVVVSTNVAETSITIDDCVYVIDSGRMKETRYDAANRHDEILERPPPTPLTSLSHILPLRNREQAR